MFVTTNITNPECQIFKSRTSAIEQTLLCACMIHLIVELERGWLASTLFLVLALSP